MSPTSYRRASFRGCPFYLEGTSAQPGRRTVVHTYPQRDKPFAEDLGRKEREHTIDGYLIGDDVVAQRKAFEEALETKGPGTLVLPNRGEMRVSITRSDVSDRIDQRGRVNLKLSFVESGEDVAPDSTADTQQQITQAVDDAYSELTRAFVDAFSTDGLPDYALAEVIDQAVFVVTTAQEMQRLLLSDYQAYSDFVAGAEEFTKSIATMFKSPEALADALIDVLQSVEKQIYPSVAAAAPLPYGSATPVAASDADDHTAPSWAQRVDPGTQAFQTMADLWIYTGMPPSVPWPSTLTITPTRQQQMQAEQALIDLVRATAFLESAAAVAAIAFDSYDASQQVQQQFFDGISDFMLEVTDDDLYFALKAVRASVTDDITARGSTLARVRTITLPQSAPALAVSYRLYGTSGNADDLCARNNVANPLQLPGGVPLEVLTDG